MPGPTNSAELTGESNQTTVTRDGQPWTGFPDSLSPLSGPITAGMAASDTQSRDIANKDIASRDIANRDIANRDRDERNVVDRTKSSATVVGLNDRNMAAPRSTGEESGREQLPKTGTIPAARKRSDHFGRIYKALLILAILIAATNLWPLGNSGDDLIGSRPASQQNIDVDAGSPDAPPPDVLVQGD